MMPDDFQQSYAFVYRLCLQNMLAETYLPAAAYREIPRCKTLHRVALVPDQWTEPPGAEIADFCNNARNIALGARNLFPARSVIPVFDETAENSLKVSQ
jgi:hypothetical protein